MTATPAGLRPPLAYYGGKTTLAPQIAAMLPAHRHYVEPFCGSLAVLLAKNSSRMETVNDLDGDLMCFWKVLREQPNNLARVCALTPHARAEHDAAYGDLTGLPELERARLVWVRLSQGRAGTLRKTGWRHYVDPGGYSTSMPGYLHGYLDRMMPVAERLAKVSLECRDAAKVIASYGRHSGCLLYVDPPYAGSTRACNYRHELDSDADHRELAKSLHACKATVVLSGYASPLYDQELYVNWYRYELTSGTSQGGTWESRIEVLWSNRPLNMPDPNEPELFDAETFRNNEPLDVAECNETWCGATDCRKVIVQPATGRRRRYCSTACRVRNHRNTIRKTASATRLDPIRII